ncbi:MAG: glycoside hydrolase family 97 protein [Prevotella sp.]|nr:glycoside hydrolase family 97 protein [Prevotella sp.]
MRRLVLSMVAAMVTAMSMSAAEYEVTSPNGKVKVVVDASQTTRWSVNYDGKTVLLPSEIGIKAKQGKKILTLGKIGKVSKKSVKSHFQTPFYKKATVQDEYGQMLLYTNQKWLIEIRAYDDGAAYRLVSTASQPLVVENETAEFCMSDDYMAFIPYVNDNRAGERYCYSFESYYDEQPLSEMFADSLAITPLALCMPGGMKAIVMDAGVENYPGMMLVKGNGNTLKAEFAPYPLEQEIGGYARLNLIPTKRADYIARIDAKQALPWRAVVITEKDADILNCDMAQRLAPACRIADTSWIKPGKVAWDWWNNLNITGVDFASGMNTNTYLYYIDFAAKNQLEYIIIDEGWSGKESLMEDLNPDIDLPRLIAYGKEKGVGIILWSSWRNLIGSNPTGDIAVTDAVMKHYADMGIKGFKVDFFDRDDQQAIASAYKVAACAASHHLYLDYHGLKPFGIQRAYPNIFNFEGVKGLENSKWEPRVGDGPLHDQPRYDVTAPYLRMLAGPMDYTPGAMVNALKDSFFGNNDHPMSQGTRVHQMAMYTVFEAPLQMLADSPTKYMQNQECTDFIAQIPTTFDETIAIDGQLGEYIVIARRKGTVWYVAAMTNWTPRELTLSLDFLNSGIHKADIFADGTNAHKEATDYRHTRKDVTSTDRIQLHLSSGGGWTAIIVPECLFRSK